MIGTLINCAAIIAGSLLGLLLRRGMKDSIAKTVMQGVGMSVILIGVTGAIETTNTLLVILSMVIGGVLGAWIDIDAKMNHLGAWAQRKLTRGDDENNTFAKGFVTASLVYCVGAMAVVGSLDSGIRGDHSTLIAKAALDGITAIIFSSSLGIGVMLSAVPVLIYQGAIALLGNAIAPLLSDVVVTEMSAVGGLLIMGIGINMLLDTEIKVANLLPAIIIPFIYYPIVQLF
ncbi:MAG: DUF554 domain-containing protein [Clostridia bacterium]|nr:DUF554 domain-containing protein [Clostridia bacterium]